MSAVTDERGEAVDVVRGGSTSRERVVFGFLLFLTAVSTAVAATHFGPAFAGKLAAAMLPALLVSSLQTDLSDDSLYGSLARRR
ncbi:MAG: hypothetical protein ABEJ82_10135 [Haloplanus sp.]